MESDFKLRSSCFIGETRFYAGIFLSRKIAMRKPYANSLRLIQFESFAEAVQRFLEMYGEIVNLKELRVNTLYQVRAKDIYSVVYTSYGAGITLTENFAYNVSCMLSESCHTLAAEHGLEYEQAAEAVRTRFVEQYGISLFYINGSIPLNQIITFETMLKRNHLQIND